ncbi:hypothetical protein BC628DRAFT_1123849 [Trametes gibbosa]|nr:hypothetical protein BC628DRAFT_1123849 [Trametes gibbosa]
MVFSGLSTGSSQDELKCSATVKDFTPIYNHLDQDPCTIGEALVTTCGALSAYTDPKGHPNNACFCNSVMYSLVYVCGECLPKVAAQFQQPSSNYYSYFECQSPMDGEYPGAIPPGTAIPAWAYLPLKDGTLDSDAVWRLASSRLPDATTSGSYFSAPLSTPGPVGNSAPPAAQTTSQGSQSTENIVPPASPTMSTSDLADSSSHASYITDTNASSTSSTSSSPLSASGPRAAASPVTTSSISRNENDRSSLNLSSSTSSTFSHPQITGEGGPAVESSAHKANHLGSILGGVFGSLIAVALATAIVLYLMRRRRRRREKAALVSSGPLDWWRRSDKEPLPPPYRPPSGIATAEDEVRTRPTSFARAALFTRSWFPSIQILTRTIWKRCTALRLCAPTRRRRTESTLIYNSRRRAVGLEPLIVLLCCSIHTSPVLLFFYTILLDASFAQMLGRPSCGSVLGND